MTTIYLIRHAEAEGNLCRRIHGWYDSLITPNGYVQIAALKKRFEGVHIDAVYSSDLRRTMTTAQAIYPHRGLPLHTRADLREINLGHWEDCTWGEIARTDVERLQEFNCYSPNFRTQGGESFREVGTRVVQALKEIANAHPNQVVAVFCHGTAIRCAQGLIAGMDLAQTATLPHCDNTGVSCFEVEEGIFRSVLQSDNSHLTEEESTLAKQHWWKKKGAWLSDCNLWFRPLDVLGAESAVYLSARQEAWQDIRGHLGMAQFDGAGTLAVAQESAKLDPNHVVCAMLGDTVAGMIQFDPKRDEALGVGYVPFVYMAPTTRKQGLGVQLLGQAISHYRKLGRTVLRLRCDPNNQVAYRFYTRHGFEKVGTEESNHLLLEILEKKLG